MHPGHKFYEEDMTELLRLRTAEDSVRNYLIEIMDNKIGVGANPIEFLIASHGALRVDNKELLGDIKVLEDEISDLRYEAMEANRHE